MTRLDRCWKNCLRMWKWVSEENAPTGDYFSVSRAKLQWLRRNGFRKPITNDCFFCQYKNAYDAPDADACDNCPGKLIEPRLDAFWCETRNRHWRRNPKAFYAKLLELDATRKK